MRYIRILLIVIVLLPVLFSCNSKLNVNANWKDITVVYGLLSQNEDTTFIKITKAFLGEGNALQFAQVPDSSNYPGKLTVKMEGWLGSTLMNTYTFDTITIHTKEKGDSVFYYPIQLVYYCKTGDLNESYTYKLRITHTKTGVIDSASTTLVHHFAYETPDPYLKKAEFLPGKGVSVVYYQAYGGKRYQLVIRVHYLESTAALKDVPKSFDWLVFNDYEVADPTQTTNKITNTFLGDQFYSVMIGNIKIDPNVTSRSVRWVDYILSVASDDLNTYMDVSAPSLSIIQERPSFSNIYNGIGLFSSRYVNELDTVTLSDQTFAAIRSNPDLIKRGF